MRKRHIGSNFDDFLREEQLLDVAKATAVKRVIAFQIDQQDEPPQADQVRDGKPHDDEWAALETDR